MFKPDTEENTMKYTAFVFTHPKAEKLIVYTNDQDKALETFSKALGGKTKVLIRQWVGKVAVKDSKVYEFMRVEHTPVTDYREIALARCPTCGSVTKVA